MRVVRRILAGLTLLIAAAVLLLSLAAAVGVWVVKGPVTAKATRTAERVEAALDIATDGLAQARTSLDRAAARLVEARAEQRALTQEPRRGVNLSRIIARNISPEITAASGKLHTVAEAAVVVNTVLEDVGNFPVLSTSGLDLDQLAEMNDRLARAGPAAWDLSRRLGDPGAAPDDAAELSRIEQTVGAMRGLVVEQESRVAAVRERAAGVKATAFRWITPVAILVTVLCVWVALSQISLMVHAWSW